MLISVILAAGEGTRMKSKLPKVVHKICGKSMVNYVVDAAKNSNCESNVVIVGHGKDKVINSIEDKSTKFETQPIGENMPYGTGYAVMQAREHIKEDDQVIVLTGDTPLITGETLTNLYNHHKSGGYKATVLTADFENPTGYGRIIRDSLENVTKIVEQKDATKEQRLIKEINSGIYCFEGKYLLDILDRLNNDNVQNEYYITDAIEILNNDKEKVGGYKLNDNTEIMGVNSRVQLAQAEKVMRNRINLKFMKEGVTFIDPENTYIEKNVSIGRDTIIYPGVVIEGDSKVGEDCIIDSNSKIQNSTIKNEVHVKSSTIIESFIDDFTKVGPYAYLRPNSHIGKNVKIGDFVEVKNSIIGNNSKASHLAYIGDAEVGKNVNIGCGVVFVNYDGKNKHKTIVKDNAFIGSNSNLVAPVIVNEKGYIAAGSTITKEVNKGDLSIARARQVNKEGWVEKNNK
ncbi:MAG: bifunctional UDP-N-acetylglucosamine diphosphorylase/glucosamine-1-phosphate N-acetyltransferase GlmU [Firmicutes bacterium]|nr:bifunctional UDP-N-acetylglucosamine diphosphorylase/glucosamine-1-phosphate N-acetyltransferase GlmU [Bacillota bacterium]